MVAFVVCWRGLRDTVVLEVGLDELADQFDL